MYGNYFTYNMPREGIGLWWHRTQGMRWCWARTQVRPAMLELGSEAGYVRVRIGGDRAFGMLTWREKEQQKKLCAHWEKREGVSWSKDKWCAQIEIPQINYESQLAFVFMEKIPLRCNCKTLGHFFIAIWGN